MAPRTKQALLDAGLIEPCGFKMVSGVRIPEFQMPVHVHMQWCAAMASDESEDADLDR